MQQIQAGKIAAKWYKNEKNGPPLGVPQWGAPMGLIFTCIPHFTSKEVFLQPVFVDFLSAVTLLLSAATLILSLPATGLFWARLSALDTPTNVFSTPLWSF